MGLFDKIKKSLFGHKEAETEAKEVVGKPAERKLRSRKGAAKTEAPAETEAPAAE